MVAETKTHDIVKNLFISAAGNFLGRGSNFFLKIVAAKYLGVELLGIYYLLRVLVSYYSYLFLGLSYVLPTEIPKFQAKNNTEKIKDIRTNVNLYYLFIISITVISFLIYITFFFNESSSPFSTINLILIFITAIFNQITNLLSKHLKSIGSFTKLFINESFIRFLNPLSSIVLIIFFGLNGYLVSELIFLIINCLNLLYFSIKIKFDFFVFKNFNLSKLYNYTKTGISLFISQNGFNISYTLLITFIGINYSIEIVGQLAFIITMLNSIVPFLRPYFLALERKIYIKKELSGSQYIDLLNGSITNMIFFGFMIQAIIILLKYIIPIFFIEFQPAIQFLTIASIITILRNTVKINNYFLNAHHLFKFRNSLLIIGAIIFIVLSKFLLLEISIFEYLIAYLIINGIIKISLNLYSNVIFKNIYQTSKVILFDLIGIIIIGFITYIIQTTDYNLANDLILLFATPLFISIASFKNPKKILDENIAFFNND